MGDRPTKVLVLGDSHIHWLQRFIADDLALCPHDLHLTNCEVGYKGIRGGTVASLRSSFDFSKGATKPDAVILHIGGNDIDNASSIPPQFVGMQLYIFAKELVAAGVANVIVCQVIRRRSWRNFDFQEGARHVTCINEFLAAACSGLEHIAFWKHRGMWQEGAPIFCADGVHFNPLGSFKLYKSVRGAVMQACRMGRRV